MRSIIVLAATGLLLAGAAAAQTRHTPYRQASSGQNGNRAIATCTAGTLTRMRMSKIKPGG